MNIFESFEELGYEFSGDEEFEDDEYIEQLSFFNPHTNESIYIDMADFYCFKENMFHHKLGFEADEILILAEYIKEKK